MAEHDENSADSGWLLDALVRPNAGLRQGDLIKFQEEKHPLKQAGIVVTADCDLDKKKHARTLTLVPIISPKVALEYYLIPEDCENKRADIESYVFKKFSIEARQDLAVKMAMLRKVFSTEMLTKETPEKIAAMFLINSPECISVAEYKILMQAINCNVKKTETLKQQIRTRGDLLVLPDPKELGINGCIAWVRHIWQVPISDVAIKTSEISSRPGERIAQLASPYRYRLTQLMAQVFSDIGLPNSPNFIDQLVEDACNNG